MRFSLSLRDLPVNIFIIPMKSFNFMPFLRKVKKTIIFCDYSILSKFESDTHFIFDWFFENFNENGVSRDANKESSVVKKRSIVYWRKVPMFERFVYMLMLPLIVVNLGEKQIRTIITVTLQLVVSFFDFSFIYMFYLFFNGKFQF